MEKQCRKFVFFDKRHKNASQLRQFLQANMDLLQDFIEGKFQGDNKYNTSS